MIETPTTFCMLATPFDTEGGIDERALRANVDRMAEAGNGIYVGSGGAGEGHALCLDELERVYRVAVEQSAGRILVFANPPEPRSAAALVEVARRAVRAGVDVVQIYQLDAGHGMRPTLGEQAAFYAAALEGMEYPAALSLHVGSGYLPPVAMIADLAGQHAHLCAVNLIGLPLTYFVAMRDALPRRVRLYSRLADALTTLPLGAAGTLSAENNLAPALCATVAHRWAQGDVTGAGEALADVMRLAAIVNRWAPSTARWVKMGMRLLGLPGHEGGLRPPYLMPGRPELAAMAEGFEKLDLRAREARALHEVGSFDRLSDMALD